MRLSGLGVAGLYRHGAGSAVAVKPVPAESQRLCQNRLIRTDTAHMQRVDVIAVTQRIARAEPFNAETKLLIQRDRPLVIGIHRQLDAFYMQPFVAQVQRGRDKFAAHASSLKPGIYADAKRGYVAASPGLFD